MQSIYRDPLTYRTSLNPPQCILLPFTEMNAGTWKYQITRPVPTVHDSVQAGANPKLSLKPVIVMLYQKESPGPQTGDKIPRPVQGHQGTKSGTHGGSVSLSPSWFPVPQQRHPQGGTNSSRISGLPRKHEGFCFLHLCNYILKASHKLLTTCFS